MRAARMASFRSSSRWSCACLKESMFERSQLSWLGPSPMVACAAVRPELVAFVVKLVRDMAFKAVIPLMTKSIKDRRPAIRSASDAEIYFIQGREFTYLKG